MALLSSSNLLFRHPHTSDISPLPKSLSSPLLRPSDCGLFTRATLRHIKVSGGLLPMVPATRVDGQGALLLGQAPSLVTTERSPQSLVWHRQKSASSILRLPLQLHLGLPQVHCKSSASLTQLRVGSHRDTCLQVQISVLVPSGRLSFYVCKATGCPQDTARS